MEIFKLERDIKVVCVGVENFPEGIVAAHEKLHELVPYMPGREYYGISWGSPNGVIYKAASNVLDGKELELGLETFTIKKGKYLREILANYQDNIPGIKETFQEMLKDPRIAPDGFCLEAKMIEKDLWCMVKIKD